MVLMPWRWYGELSGFSKEMNQLFDRFFGHDLTDRPWETASYPPMTVEETDLAVVVRMELHGFLPRDLEITFQSDTLQIKGSSTRRTRTDEPTGQPPKEVRASFVKTIHLGKNILTEAIEAKFRDGVLIIVLPKKTEPPEPHVISIE